MASAAQKLLSPLSPQPSVCPPVGVARSQCPVHRNIHEDCIVAGFSSRELQQCPCSLMDRASAYGAGGSGFDPLQGLSPSPTTLSFRPVGVMDSALDFGSKGYRFKSGTGLYFLHPFAPTSGVCQIDGMSLPWSNMTSNQVNHKHSPVSTSPCEVVGDCGRVGFNTISHIPSIWHTPDGRSSSRANSVWMS